MKLSKRKRPHEDDKVILSFTFFESNVRDHSNMLSTSVVLFCMCLYDGQ